MKKVQAVLLGILLLAVLIGSRIIDFSKTENTTGEPAPVIGAQLTPGENMREGATRTTPEPSTVYASAGNKVPGSNPASGNPLSQKPKWASLEEQMRRDTEGLSIKIHPDGHGSLNGGGRFTHMSAAVRDASGRMVIQCFEGYAGLDDSLSGRTQAPAPIPERIDYEVSDF